MNLITKGMRWKTITFIFAFLAMLGQACTSAATRAEENGDFDGESSFTPYIIADSSKIINFPSGLQLYIVEPGPGKMPANGSNVRMHYHGHLKNGKVFDESFDRKPPFEFRIGSKNVIEGLQEALQNMRYGTKAIAIIPPELGYGDGLAQGHKDKHLPKNIPANSTLIFHIHLLGSF